MYGTLVVCCDGDAKGIERVAVQIEFGNINDESESRVLDQRTAIS